MGIENTLHIAASGMNAQSERLKIIAQNIANADSTALSPEELPYRRQVVLFKNVLDKEMGLEKVKVAKRTHDMSDFKLKYEPHHPAANENGYILLPNVNSIVEMIDMREARRGYEANLGVVEVARAMVVRTLELLR